jgi:hypothetical protein
MTELVPFQNGKLLIPKKEEDGAGPSARPKYPFLDAFSGPGFDQAEVPAGRNPGAHPAQGSPGGGEYPQLT